MKLYLTVLFLLLLNINGAIAQTDKNKKPTKALWEFLKGGEINGHVRTYYMTTINEKKLTDYHALGLGVGIRYETPKFKGFQIAIGGSSIFNIASTPLDQLDSSTNKYSRYETGLFDVTSNSNKSDLNKLEEFYLKYSLSKSSIVIGRQLLKTPFINPQDGRIRPTFEEGIWLDIKEVKNLTINLGYLWRMAPRSTVSWYSVANSIGLYPVGKNLDGTNSGYSGNLESAGIVLVGAKYKTNFFSIQVWDQLVANMFNTIYVQADFVPAIDSSQSIKAIAGIQAIAQQPIASGGNSDLSKTYYDPSQSTWIVGGQLGMKINELRFDFNYTYIFGTGRFLMPREWGKEPLYTFIPRERTEGAGNVHSISTNWLYNFSKLGLKAKASYGYYIRPDAKDFRLNKYALASYGHFEIMIDKTFNKYLKGLHFKLLYMYKHSMGETYENPNFIFNKVNMHHLDLIINYNF